MDNFPNFLNENMGGLAIFKFVPVHDVSEIPYTINKVLTGAVTLQTDKQWYTGRALPRTLSFSEQQNTDGTYTYTLSGSATGTDEDMVPLLDDISRREHLIDCTDFNQNRRLLGIIGNGAQFTWSHDTTSSPSGLNKFTYTFTVTLAEPAKIYAPA